MSSRDFRKINARWMRRIRPDDLWNLHEIRPHMNYTEYRDPVGFLETSLLHTDQSAPLSFNVQSRIGGFFGG